ncbi:ABC transporter ATP-binding protein [Brevibacillus sp. HB1.2]|uniref:ABC transporter ATP-binding protein n=1 Tax=Brevibacillus TaxID=55080 RepID=UPI0003739641|nr:MULTISPECIES: ABC transporter ATP-binding protein [unclassified Brevibacillus]ATF12161.1 ABC transporter ATP-binding protein [Brevibacillus brevis X23]NRS16404.1 ABC transporter ATP-binding protein [Brevibacillus sp. HB1.4B]NTU20446.1 ABC transporter ATP-binding protein [Brevibacillus sp. HB1.2]NTU32276.1 ABC transporter ATP-binding protein [Brevibacillus sp. HB1.1]
MIVCENLVKIYKANDLEVVALQGLDLRVETGELMGIIGNSGSGKSTLLNMLGGLDRPSAGKLSVAGADLFRLTTSELVQYRLQTVGFVWQNNARNLIPYLSALQNVEMPMLLRGKRKRERAHELLELVGLGHRKKNKLSELSGGEQQRVAIAIALANEPKLLLADEPTGSVDTRTAAIILDLFQELNRSFGLTVVIVTHDLELARKVDRVVAIRDGKTSSELLRRKGTEENTSESSDESANEDTHEELAVLDQVGRLQIPMEYLQAIQADGKLRIELEEDRIILKAPVASTKTDT